MTDLSPSPPATLNLDLDRVRRCGFPEVVYAAGKTVEETCAAAQGLFAAHQRALVTRCRPEQMQALRTCFPQGRFCERSGAMLVGQPPMSHGPIAVISAGTSDEAVAEEAELTALARGVAVHRLRDCGVAGLHRFLTRLPELDDVKALVVVAGFEAALTSVVAGLVSCPVIGCPTSVGYGVCNNGHTALHAMLACCAPGVTVVNIDNGFGAGYAAAGIALQGAPMPGAPQG
ncbi:MAG: nickel pincer cofactor biosynthesis protein LarB [Planctomycetota bacterium]|nr:MAG: nickel pincer cofactor biosynthesis protein LarB [Planctomycetota bacterium]